MTQELLRIPHLERLHEGHCPFVLEQTGFPKKLSNPDVIHRLVNLRVRVLDCLHTLILPGWELRGNVDPHTLRLLGVKRCRLALILALGEFLQKRRFRVSNPFDRLAHVCDGFNYGPVDRFIGSRPESQLNRCRFFENGCPDVFCEVRRDGRGEKSGTTDPVEDELGMHANIRCYLAVPVTGRLKLIEPIFHCIFVVRAGKSCWDIRAIFAL